MILFGNPDGTLDIIEDGELEGVFGMREIVLLTPSIPSIVTTIPLYLQASQNVNVTFQLLNRAYHVLLVILLAACIKPYCYSLGILFVEHSGY